MATLYQDRVDAGQQLATLLTAYAHRQDVLVLALPRGGVPVGYEIARALEAPLDVFLVRKLGVPGQEELAMGAIAIGGIRVLNRSVVETLQIPPHIIDNVVEREQRELARRVRLYRDERVLPDVQDATVILVDDGLATGATMRAAARALRLQKPKQLVIAVPVAAESTCFELRLEGNDIICGQTPEPFYGVGWWYKDFSQTTDEEVHRLLTLAEQRHPVAALKHR